MARTVGIDLGTTNSLVAYVDPQTGEPKCIPGPNGSTLCPSVVSLDPDGSIIMGEPARRRLLTQPERTIYSVKRLMGRGVADIQDELKLFPFRIDRSSKSVIRVKLGDRYFTPPEISSFILRELKNWAEAYFGENVERAVITVPAYFSDAQRQGVIVYAIYVRDLGTNGLAGAEATNGQNYLVQLTTATGGKAYYNGTFSSPDFRPYFDDLKKQLDSQYQLKFTTTAKSKDSVGLKVKIDGAKVHAQSRVYLEEGAQ